MPYKVVPRAGNAVSGRWASMTFTDPAAKKLDWHAAPAAELITTRATPAAEETHLLPKLSNTLAAAVSHQPIVTPRFPARPLPQEAVLASMKRGRAKKSDNIRFRLDE